MRILVAGVISLSPFSPGMAWNWLQILVGLRRLGHDVYFVEEVEPEWCVDRRGRPARYEQSLNRQRFLPLMARFGFGAHACQVYDGGEATTGLSFKQLLEIATDADLLLNISGHLKTRTLMERIDRRVYVDQDPVFTQLWRAEYGKDLGWDDHHCFLTVGLNIGTGDTPIPDCGIAWHQLLPAVVLDFWPYAFDAGSPRFTTIASLYGYKDLCYRGLELGAKYKEFNRLAELPRRIDQPLELATKHYGQNDELVRRLTECGWVITEGSRIRSLRKYQEYIAGSRGEIGIAKGAYVDGESGWFSDRTAHYLASGKPVLAQATGFENHLPTGDGLLVFSTLDEAVEGIGEINGDYERHCRAARGFAEEYLDYRKVLPPILEACCGS